MAAVRASGFYLAVTGPTGFLEPGIPLEELIKHFDRMLSILNVEFYAFFIMGKDIELEAISGMFPFPPRNIPAGNLICSRSSYQTKSPVLVVTGDFYLRDTPAWY